MALKAFDGYDHYNQKADILSRSGFLQYGTGAINGAPLSIVPGRNGFGKAMEIDFNSPLSIVWAARNAEMVIGVAVLWGIGGGATFEFIDSVTGLTNITVWFNPTNYAVQIYRGPPATAGNVLLYASPNNTWTGQVWNFVEFKFLVSATVGYMTVHVNGVEVATITGVNTNWTQPSPSITANLWADLLDYTNSFNAGTSSHSTIDDLYYCDTTTGPGTYPCNDFLGDCKVDTLFTIGNNSVQWTPLANTNWQELREIAMDSDTSYNFTSTATLEDLLNFGTLDPLTVTIFGLQVTGAYRKDDAGVRTIKQALKVGATEVYGSTWSIPDTSYAYFTDLWVLNPNTSANWAVSEVNGLSAGYNLVS